MVQDDTSVGLAATNGGAAVVLVIQGCRPSDEAFAQAVQAAQERHQRLVVVSCPMPASFGSTLVYFVPCYVPIEPLASPEELAREVLRDLPAGLPVTYVCLHGTRRRLLQKALRRFDASLVVYGSSTGARAVTA